MKKVIVVGGGISGCFAAIRIKEKHPDYQVDIFEHNDKLLKKIYATGNGHVLTNLIVMGNMAQVINLCIVTYLCVR